MLKYLFRRTPSVQDMALKIGKNSINMDIFSQYLVDLGLSKNQMTVGDFLRGMNKKQRIDLMDKMIE